jgi:hypothetical protein
MFDTKGMDEDDDDDDDDNGEWEMGRGDSQED